MAATGAPSAIGARAGGVEGIVDEAVGGDEQLTHHLRAGLAPRRGGAVGLDDGVNELVDALLVDLVDEQLVAVDGR